MRFELSKLVRPNILSLEPYSSARSEFSGTAAILLDANENAFGSPAGEGMNRYPDPLQTKLKRRVAELNRLSTGSIFVGSGSDEAIDLLFRIFCCPGQDEAIVCPPTYGMYAVAAAINDIRVVSVPLSGDFQLDVPAIKSAFGPRTKMVFICSPNNPTGNLMSPNSIVEIARSFEGIVVVDEAYIQFAGEPSFTEQLNELPNLVVLQTLSKAWGMAGLRIGFAFAGPAIVSVMNKVKPPYNISSVALNAAASPLESTDWLKEHVQSIRFERERLREELLRFAFITGVYPSDANFLFAAATEPIGIHRHLAQRGIIVRDRSTHYGCRGCLRITVGSPKENEALLAALGDYVSAPEDGPTVDEEGK